MTITLDLQPGAQLVHDIHGFGNVTSVDRNTQGQPTVRVSFYQLPVSWSTISSPGHVLMETMSVTVPMAVMLDSGNWRLADADYTMADVLLDLATSKPSLHIDMDMSSLPDIDIHQTNVECLLSNVKRIVDHHVWVLMGAVRSRRRSDKPVDATVESYLAELQSDTFFTNVLRQAMEPEVRAYLEDLLAGLATRLSILDQVDTFKASTAIIEAMDRRVSLMHGARIRKQLSELTDSRTRMRRSSHERRPESVRSVR